MAGERGDPGDLLLAFDGPRHRLQLLSESVDRRFDPLLQGHRIGAGGDRLEALPQDVLGQDRGGRRTVTHGVVRLARGDLHELSAHVLERVFELDLLGDRHSVAADLGQSEVLVEDDVPAGRPEGDSDGSRQDVDTLHQLDACVGRVLELLWHEYNLAL